MQHEDGVGGSFKYELDETNYNDGKNDIRKEANQLLSEVSTTLTKMQTRLDHLDELQAELENLWSTVNSEIANALENWNKTMFFFKFYWFI